jgi:hypothetical protein
VSRSPYYSDELVTIYHGDCRELLPTADAVVTDPPYGTGAYTSDTDVLTGALLNVWMAAIPSAAIFGWPEKLVALCIAAGRVPNEWVTWWPSNAELKGRFTEVPVARDTEHIALFGRLHAARGAPEAPSRIRAAAHPADRGKHHISPKGKRWGDVWRDASPGLLFQHGERLHPNQKPIAVMSRLIQMMADGTVLDPFMGSGTTLVAAKSLGRKSIGIEIEERYCEIAAQRCSQEILGLVSA